MEKQTLKKMLKEIKSFDKKIVKYCDISEDKYGEKSNIRKVRMALDDLYNEIENKIVLEHGEL